MIRPVQGNLHGILSQLMRKSQMWKLIVEQKEHLKMLSYKMKQRLPWGMSPRHVRNRRRRTRKGPEPACVRARLLGGWHTQGVKGELTSCRGTVQSAWSGTSSETEGRPGCPHGCGRHVRGRQSSSIPAQQPAVSVAVRRCAQVTGKAGEND